MSEIATELQFLKEGTEETFTLFRKRNELIWKALEKIQLVLAVKFPNDPTINELGRIINYYKNVLE